MAVLLAGALAACAGYTTPTSSSSQTPPTTEPPTPPAAPTVKYTKYLAFGDSMTEGKTGIGIGGLFLLDLAGYPPKLVDLLRARYTAQQFTVFNAGYGGETTADGRQRLPGVIASNNPEVVLLLEGANDLNTPVTTTAAADNLREMAAATLRSGVAVVIATLPPQNPAGFRAGGAARVPDLNARIVAIAQDLRIPLADLYKTFGGDLTLLSADGLHPNDAGYGVIAQTWFETIKSAWEQGSMSSRRATAAETTLTGTRPPDYTRPR